MFNSKLRKKIEQLEQENMKLHNTVSVLLKEIERRDAIIAVERANAPDPFAFDFPGTEKSFEGFWDSFTKDKKS